METPDGDGTERLALAGSSPMDSRYATLRDLIPEAFGDGELDLRRLGTALGLTSEPESERYGLSWPGKHLASATRQEPSIGTLRPDPHSGHGPPDAPDVVIEGDNLEVLKLLQKSYHAKVKMIYIDPPYNTGNQFIYPDNFREGLATYLEFTGQTDDSGRKLTANTETNGRYHSNWLSMMYPRLSLARHLLRDDGVIFITIDDNEVHNLRLIMDELFGPENFIACCIWQKVFSPKNTAQQFSEDHDYLLVYGRNGVEWRPNLLPRTEDMEDRYSNPDDDLRGPWTSSDLSARNYYSKGTYSITTPSGREISGPPSGTYWRYSEPRFKELDADDRIWWGADGDGVPRIKRFLSEVRAGLVPQTLWRFSDVGHTQEAKKELLDRVTFESSESVYDTPKPTRLIERMLRLATQPDSNDIVMDFFAGSGTTGEAVWKLNLEDGGNRRFILVQFPEPTGHSDYTTVADITRARLRGAAESLASTATERLDVAPELGFRSYRLSESNFRVWDITPEMSDEEIETALLRLVDNVREDATKPGMVVELLLTIGYELTSQVDELTIEGKTTYSVNQDEVLIFLDDLISVPIMDDMVARSPSQILVLDKSFGGSVERKYNVMQTVRTANQTGNVDIATKVI